MGDESIVKLALTILCSLLLMLGQAAVASMPAASAKHDCGCGGKMSCCQHASVPSPFAAIAPARSHQQMLTPVPAMAIWILSSPQTSSISPTASAALTSGAAPLFARDCARLL